MTHEELTYEGLKPAEVPCPPCPKCGSPQTIRYRTWVITTKNGTRNRISLFCCQKCGKRFRKGEGKE